MKKYIKAILILICLHAFLISIQAQEKYDLFPLQEDMTYTYNFFHEVKDWALQIYLKFWYSDFGKVEYIINNFLNYGDTLIVWNIEQRRNLIHIDRFTGSYISIIDTTDYQLYENLTGDHELRCSSPVWLFPLYYDSDSYFSVYRYSEQSEKLIIYHIQPRCGETEDSMWFSEKAGMYKRVNQHISDCGIDKSEDKSFAYRIGIPDKVEINKARIINKFILFQNYPNPFNPTTKIEYHIPEMSLVTIKIYDVLGREITTLVNEEKPAGNYEFEFDATGLPSGIYFYQLKAGDYFETKKMMLLK